MKKIKVVGGTEPFKWTWQDKDGVLHDTNFGFYQYFN